MATVTGNIKNKSVSNTATTTTTVRPGVDLTVVQHSVFSHSDPPAPDAFRARDDYNYVITVGNSGLDDATNVVIREPLPAGVLFKGFTPPAGQPGVACGESSGGDAVHVFVSGGTAYVVQSSSLTSLSRSCTGGNPKVCTAIVQAGSATTTAIDLATGTASAVPGTSSIRIDATDAAEPGDATPADRYAVAISGATGYALGTPESPLPIGYGNIRVPS